MRMTMSRRAVLRVAGLALAPAVAAAQVTAVPALGFQIYVFIQQAMHDLPGALKQVADTGATEVEMMAGPGGSPARVAEALRNSGLACRSLHVPPYPVMPGAPSLQDLDGVMALAHDIGVRYVVCTFPLVPAASRTTIEGASHDPGAFARGILAMDDAAWRTHYAFLNRTGEVLSRAGLRLAYHNHAPDFAPVPGGTRYDHLMTQTDPGHVWLELDCGWAAAAGADPASLIKRTPERFRLLHLKDLAPGQQTSLSGSTRTLMPMGTGTLDWTAILHAARAAQVEAMFIEEDPPYPRPPAEDAGRSLRWLRSL
jgi:sugar phosphate isomerase/epimerase